MGAWIVRFQAAAPTACMFLQSPRPMTHSHSQTPLPSEPIERLAWWVAACLSAICLTCVHLILTKPYGLASFDRLVNFQAVEPFQHRVLIPALVAGVEQIMPLGHVILFALAEAVFWLALLVVAYRAVTVLRLGQSQALRRALAFTLLVPMVLTLIMPDLRMVPELSIEDGVLDLGHWWALAVYYYPYDLPAAVFTLALALMLFDMYRSFSRRRLVMFLAVFALATSNRETTIFLVPMTALLFWGRLSLVQWAALLAAECVVFVAVEAPLHWLFSDHPNPHRALSSISYENHLMGNLALFKSPIYVLTFAVRFAGGCLLPIVLWWRYLDRRMLAALFGFVLPLVVFAFVVGRVPEHRIFTEAVPLIWLAALQAVVTRVAVDDAAPERGRRLT